MPPHWQLHIEGADTGHGHFHLEDGHVLQATFVPEVPTPEVPRTPQEESDSELGTPDPSVDAENDSMSSAEARPRSSRSRSSARSRSPRRGGGEFVDSLNHGKALSKAKIVPPTTKRGSNAKTVGCFGWFFAGVCSFGLSYSTAMPIASIQAAQPALPGVDRKALHGSAFGRGRGFASGHSSVTSTRRTLPTPCRSRRPVPIPPDTADYTEATTPLSQAVHSVGPIAASPPPRDCPSRSQHSSAQTIVPLSSLRTLLEESVLQSDCRAMFLAATLIETLVEHFGESMPDQMHSQTQEVVAAARRRTVLSLDVLVNCAGPSASVAGVAEGARSARDAYPTPFPGSPSFLALHPLPTLELDCLPPAAPVLFGETPLGFSWLDVTQLLHLDPLLRPWDSFFTAAHPRTQRIQEAIAGLAEEMTRNCILCYTDGSFFPSSEESPARLGWACIFVDPLHARCAWVAGPVPDWLLAGEQPSAYSAECVALLIGQIIAAVADRADPITFRSDCQSAVGIVSGQTAYKPSIIPSALAHASAFRGYLHSQGDSAEYVPGHSGHFFNETADDLAKWGARQSETYAPLSEGHLLHYWLQGGGQALSWAGLAIKSLRGSQTLPPLWGSLGADDDHAGLSGAQLVAPFIPPGTNQTAPVQCPERQVMRLQALIVSYNTLSLGATLETAEGQGEEGPGLQYRPGRAALLADQLHDLGATIVALQETRCQEGHTTIGKYIRLSAGAPKGQLGTELWFHTERPLLLTGKAHSQGVCFAAKDLVVVHADPRRILVRFQYGCLKLLFSSLHAPHRGSEHHIIAAWWKETLSLLYKYGQTASVILAGDANASVGSRTSVHVGPVAAEDEDAPGEWWHQALKSTSCFLPCTFEELQQGPTATYHQKRNGHACRPDMIGTPRGWQEGQVTAWVAPELHVAHAYQDHFATCVQLSVQMSLPRKATTGGRKRIDANILSDPRHHEDVRKVLMSTPEVPWGTSAHAHAAILVNHLQEGLARIAGTATPRPRHPYIQETTWALQKQVTNLKRSLHRLRQQVKSQLQAICFVAWKAKPAVPGTGAAASPLRCAWMRKATFSELALQYHTNRACRMLRRECRADRDRYIADLAQKVADCPCSEVFATLHRLLGHKRKKPFAPEPLPKLLTADGHACQDIDAVNRRWREHFGAMEGGRETDFAQLPDIILAGSASAAAWPAPACASQIPSIADLQKVMIRTKPGKAPGPDGIPGSLLKHFALDMSALVHPLLLKLALRGCEGIGFKGGLAVKFWKGKGSKQEASSYRQILLVSNIAKSIHQALRPALRDLFSERTPALQLGGKPGGNVVYGAHITRSFLRWQSARHGSCFILFTDIASAFYSVARQLVAKTTDSPACPDLEQSGLLPGEIEELRGHIAGSSALTEAGASSWLEALSQQLTQDTWFLLQNDHCPVITSKGTRPGSSWADLLFAFVVKKITERRDALLAASAPHALEPHIPADCDRTLLPCDSHRGSRPLSDLVWADDIATMRVTRQASQLLSGIKTTVGASCDSFAEHGFHLSYGPRKTAVLAQPAGAGTKSARRDIFGIRGCHGQVSVLREHTTPTAVPLIHTYRHLGAQTSLYGRMKQEIGYRVAQAKAAFQESRRKVFRSPGISLLRKAYIFQANVLPRLLYGAGAWPPLNEQESRAFKGALWQMYRQMLCIPRQGDQHYSGPTVLALLGLPGPEVLLHGCRLLYVGQLLRSGPDELWTLLRLDRPYCESLLASCRWLFRWVHSTCPLPDPDLHWEDWKRLSLQQPARLKGWIKRTQALEVRQAQVVAALDGLYRALRARTQPQEPPAAPTSAHREVCIPCKKIFQSRVAWSCHSQKVHGYRTPAFLLGSRAQTPLCTGCGKLFASKGRLQRHLAYFPHCIRHWGNFQADAAGPSEALPQAPPERLPGCSRREGTIAYDPEVSSPLLAELTALDCLEEDAVWDIIASHIEPIAVLRSTVLRWGQTSPQPDANDTAHNMLLLLDPDLLGDTVVPTKHRPVHEDQTGKVWAPLPSTRLLVVGGGPPCQLVEPPSQLLPPSGPCSIPLRQATAYATWLESACAVIAGCLGNSDTAPASILCPGIECKLGPAASWLLAVGAVFHPEGLDFARG